MPPMKSGVAQRPASRKSFQDPGRGDSTTLSPSFLINTSESPRVYRRLYFLRGWGHEQIYEIFP